MAFEYFQGGSTFASTAFLTAAGAAGSGFADGCTLVVGQGADNVTSSIDWSALATGVESVDITAGFLGSSIGSPAGPLKLDADNSTDARVSFQANGTLFLQAGGASANIKNYYQTARGRAYLLGGTVEEIHIGGGVLNVNESTTCTALRARGGNSIVDYKTNDLDILDVDGGTVYVKRRVDGSAIGDFRVSSGSVIYDVALAKNPPTYITVGSNGTVRALKIGSGAAITGAFVDGLLDLRDIQLVDPSAALTITSVYYGPRGKILLPSYGVTITNSFRGSGVANLGGFIQDPQ